MINKFLIALLALSISSNAFGAAPVITDLASGSPTVNSIPLSWSVSSGGPATAYELRYSTAPVDAGNFASAVPLGGVAAPTGGTESHTVSSLACGTKYWFGVMAYDATGASALSNVVKVSTSTCTLSFADAGNYALPGSPHASATGDFNNDGKPDLAIGIFSNAGSNYVSVMLGNGGGTFQSAVNYGTGNIAGTYFLATGDFNGDGRLDLVAANWLAGNISIFIGNGDGTFLGAVNYSVSQGASSVATGDFNGDGKLDLAVTIQDYSQLKIFPGNGDGTFGSAATYSTDHPMMVIVRDFNCDGKLDLAVTNLVASTVSIRLGNGDGTFQDAASYATGAEPLGIVAQDINGDGTLDLLVSRGEGAGSVYILLGNGDGSFLPYTTHQGGDPASRYVTLSDLNGDGIADLIDSGAGVYVSVGNGDGTFKTAVNFSAGTGPVRTVVVDDYNRDGKPDLATANYGGSNASILLNNSAWSSAGNFAPAVTYASGGDQHGNPGGTHRLTGASFEKNGKLDLVVTNHWDGNVSKLKGNGDGTFGAAVNYGAGNSPFDVIAGDYSRDGVPDLAVVNHWSHDISVLKGIGNGSFQGAANYGVGTVPTSIASGDFNGDGITDFAVTNRDSNNVSILIGQAGGSYLAAINYGVGLSYHHIVTEDLDGNGTLDLALSNAGDDTLSILLGNGNGTFQTADNFGSGGDFPREVVAGDFNADGKPDLAVVNQESNNVGVLIGTGSGNFAGAVTYPVGETPVPLSVADINRDGKEDLIAGNYEDNSISILYGKGDGTFNSAQTFPVVTPHGLFVGDFNGDGKPDISAASWNNNGISVLLNTAPLPTVPQQGLVALWRAENNALDSIGGNHGTTMNATSYAAGRYGQAFSFDGSTGYVTVANESNFDFERSTPFSIGAWVKTSGSASGDIFSKYADAPEYTGYQLVLVNGQVHFYLINNWVAVSNVLGVRTSEVINDGAFHHVAVTYDGSSIAAGVRIYIDGLSQTMTTIYDSLSSTILNDTAPSISKNLAGNYFNGLIDEVAIYNRALAANEIASMSGQTPNPFSFTPQTGMPLSTTIVSNSITVTGISYATAISITGGDYKVNGGSWTSSTGTVNNGDTVVVRQTSSAGYSTPTTTTLTIGGVSGTFSVTTAAATDPNASGLVSWWRAENNGYDSVGGNHGTAMNGASYATGKVNLAFSLDGSDDAVRVPAASNLAVSSLTIAAWIKPAIDTTMPVIEWNNETGAAPSFGPQLWYRADGRLFGNVTELAETFFDTASGVITVGAWNYVALTYDAASGIERLYANGAQAQEKSVGTLPLHTDFLLFIGRRPSSHNGPQEVISFNGLIDEVKVFNRALSASEIIKLNDTVPDTFSFTAQTGMPLSASIVSNPVTVTGIDFVADISITGGDYQINGDSWTSSAGTVNNGDTVKVRVNSSSVYATPTTATLTIGGVSGDFTVTTAEAGDPNASGLVAWWKGENNAFDSIGGNHGTWSGAPAYATGHEEQAFNFDGVDDYVLIGDPIPESLRIQNEISLEAWVYITEYAPGMGLIVGSQYDANHAGASLILNCQDSPIGSIYFDIGDGSWHNTVTSTLLPLNQWVHIVASRKANEDGKVYFNGILQPSTSQPWSGPISYSGAWFAIGQQKDQNRPFNGLIDEVKVFNRALSATEVSRLAGTYPDVFSFPDKNAANLGTLTESDAITITGITQPAPISINVGMYSISSNGTNWSDYSSTTPATVSANNQVKVRLTSSSSYATPTTTTLNIGGREGTFSVTTKADNDKPFVTAFTLIDDESTTMTVSVATFIATDISGVTGYMVTSSATPPLPGSPGWIASPLTMSFTLTTAGLNTLYAWAKDQAGNVSNPATATVNLMPVRRGTSSFAYYDSINAACTASPSGETIKALAVTVPGNVTITDNKNLTLNGGYQDGYGDLNRSTTTIQGTLTIGTGSLIVDRVAIR